MAKDNEEKVSSLALAMMGLTTSPEVLSELMKVVKFPQTRPTYWGSYPDLGAPLSFDASLAFAKRSVMHAMTLASSSSTSPEVLNALARFPQKSVRRAVALSTRLLPETIEYLTAWSVSSSDSETLQNITASSDPRIWYPAYKAKASRDLSHSQVVSYITSRIATEDYWDLFDFCYANAPHVGADSRARRFLAGMLVEAAWASPDRPFDMTELFARIDPSDAATFTVLCIPPSQSVVFSPAEETAIVAALASFDEASGISSQALTDASRASHPSLSADAARALLSLDRPSAALLAFTALSGRIDSWPTDLVCQVAEACPTEFAYFASSRDSTTSFPARVAASPLLLSALDSDVEPAGASPFDVLTPESLRRVIEDCDPAAWMRLPLAPALASRFIANLPSDLSLRLALLIGEPLFKRIIADGVEPSFSPSEFIEALSGPVTYLTSYHHSPGPVPPGRMGVNEVWATSPYDRSEANLVVTFTHRLYSHSYTDAGKVSSWTFQLLDTLGMVTCPRAYDRPNEVGRIDVFTFVAYKALERVIGSNSAAWLPALALMPSWSASVTELGHAAAEMVATA